MDRPFLPDSGRPDRYEPDGWGGLTGGFGGVQTRLRLLESGHCRRRDSARLLRAEGARDPALLQKVCMSRPPPDWVATAHRATLRLHATTANSRGANHHVYIALLEDPRRACRWGLYVGETSRDPDQRFDQHKTGYKASREVNRFGVRLLPDLVDHLNPLRRWEALELEGALAEELGRAGISWVAGGH
jgi:hypothetical protein